MKDLAINNNAIKGIAENRTMLVFMKIFKF